MCVGWVLLIGFALLRPVQPASPARYRCEVQPGPPARVRVYRATGETEVAIGPELVYRHPGKMASAADIDRDGRLDLLVLVHKSTRYDPEPAWRPFVYTLEGDVWAPKWLGSRVGRPLLEAAFVHTPHGVRMLTIEHFGDGQTGLTLYHWRGFGFWGEWTGEPMAAASDLRAADANGDGIDQISVRSGESRRTYVYCDGGYTPVAADREEGK